MVLEKERQRQKGGGKRDEERDHLMPFCLMIEKKKSEKLFGLSKIAKPCNIQNLRNMTPWYFPKKMV